MDPEQSVTRGRVEDRVKRCVEVVVPVQVDRQIVQVSGKAENSRKSVIIHTEVVRVRTMTDSERIVGIGLRRGMDVIVETKEVDQIHGPRRAGRIHGTDEVGLIHGQIDAAAAARIGQ